MNETVIILGSINGRFRKNIGISIHLRRELLLVGLTQNDNTDYMQISKADHKKLYDSMTESYNLEEKQDKEKDRLITIRTALHDKVSFLNSKGRQHIGVMSDVKTLNDEINKIDEELEGMNE